MGQADGSGAKGAGGRTRRRVDVRHEEILHATMAEIERVGLAAVRVSDVAHALGVSTGLVFYHFGTRDELVAQTFRFAVQQDLDRLRRVAARAATAPERVRAILRTSGPTGRALGWRLWIDGWSVAQREPAVAAQLRRLDAELRDVLRAAVDEGLADGSFRCADPEAAVARLGALVDGLSVAVVVQKSISRADLRRWVDEALAQELDIR